MKKGIILFYLMASAYFSAFGQTGSIFLFEQFVNAKVHFKNHAVTVYAMNYDANNGKMFFEQNGTRMELTGVHAIDTIAWGKRSFIPQGRRFWEVQRLDNGIVYIDWLIKAIHLGKKGVFGLPSQGTIQTLKLHDFGGGTPGYTPYDNQSAYATDMWRRKNDNTYYISVGGNLCKVKSVKHLYKLFPEHETEIRTYVKDEKLDIKDPLSALHLLNYCLQWVQ
ncbi:MAG: hypothetical protein K2G02_08710 [Phocaeicola sp.]|uniref:hypothetical protein n=1 Tax=Phocaeicola sp. TaxID=2773926 RepID=UPI0023C4CE46|nr:hypothetical protein [Phocaeicola sp.]MDE5677940.1 hypothetical protein [Phocaeicola sp.]MDE6181176.1 hypothetical protein [Phocaeicola sp.]